MDDIEVRVNKEINTFKEKFYFNLTGKQLIYSVIAIVVVVPIYLSLHNFSEDIASLIVMGIGGFILALGWYEPLDISFFHYIQIVIRNHNCFEKPLTKKSDVFHEYYNEITRISKDKKGERNGKEERKSSHKET